MKIGNITNECKLYIAVFQTKQNEERKEMKTINQFIVLTIIVSSALFFSCDEFLPNNKEKIAEYERTIETLNSQIALLQEEIDNIKKTDQYYYQAGADEFINKNYEKAIFFMNSLKIKFPTSSFIGYADKIIKDSEKIIKDSNKNRAIIWGDENNTPIPHVNLEDLEF
jgi:outer membrane murein-binding lipoprotein Lpp